MMSPELEVNDANQLDEDRRDKSTLSTNHLSN